MTHTSLPAKQQKKAADEWFNLSMRYDAQQSHPERWQKCVARRWQRAHHSQRGAGAVALAAGWWTSRRLHLATSRHISPQKRLFRKQARTVRCVAGWLNGARQPQVRTTCATSIGFLVRVERWSRSMSVTMSVSGMMHGMMMQPVSDGLAWEPWHVAKVSEICMGPRIDQLRERMVIMLLEVGGI